MRGRLVTLGLVAVGVSLSPIARADATGECLDAYEAAQRTRQDGKLRASRAELAICAREACPGSIRKDCGRWLDEVEQATPSVIPRATGARGEDLADVTVTIDDEVVATELTGTAIPVDPGSHRFVFTRPGQDPLVVEHVIAEGEKRRMVSVSFSPAADEGSEAQAGLESGAPSTSSEAARPIPTMTWVLGGVAVGGLAGFGYFALRGSSTRSDLDGCRPFCAQGDIDASRRNYVIADVFLGVAVAALVGAAVVYLTRSSRTSAAASAAGWPVRW
jgi:hypothetical protein